jgi:hypothetical protein
MTLRSIRADALDSSARIIIETDGLADFRDFALADPSRIVIDVAVARCEIKNKSLPVSDSLVQRVRVGRTEAGNVRVVLDTGEKTPYRVSREGAAIIITVGNIELPPAVRAPREPEVRVAAARVEADDPKDEREETRTMMRRIEELEARVRELEASRTAQPTVSTAPVPANATTVAARAVSANSHAQDHDAPVSVTPRMELQGYADVSFHASNEKGSTSSFAVGQVDLFITSRLSDKFSVLAEMILEAGKSNVFSFELHRLLLRYAPNDYLNLGVGRYHTAIGYYNAAYHHGQWFQTAATRPYIFGFESQGGILPIHNVGLTATGKIPSGTAGLRYIAEIGNGRASHSPLAPAVQTAADENNGKSFNLGLLSRPEKAPGLQMGFSVYHDKLTPDSAPRVRQTISSAHIVYRDSNYEWLNEALDIRHAVAGGRVFHTPAFYTQIARRIGEAWPYFRYQYLNIPDDDPINGETGRRNGPSAGLRYNLSEFVALKVQYDRTQRRRLKSLDELVIQLGFTF